jgi:hypothetical protein
VKKLIIFAVALLALGFAANSFAIQAEIPADTTAVIAKGGTQVTIGGELRVRGISAQNTRDFDRHITDGDAPSYAKGKPEKMLYDYRYRLNIEAKVTPNTKAFIQLDGSGENSDDDNGEFGSPDNPSNVAKKNGGSYRFGDQKLGPVRMSQAWIQHSGSGLIGVPSYIKVGHQPITIGAGIFYSHTYNNDDAIVMGIEPIKGLDFTGVIVKLQENGDLASDDQDLYSLIISYAINKKFTIGADVSFLESRPGTLFPANSDNGGIGITSRLWNFGFNAKANLAGFKLYGTFDFQAGGDNAPGVKWNYRGYAATLGASYKFAPVTVALDLGYGSGDNKEDNKVGTFLTSQSNTVHYTFVYDYHTVNAAGNRTGGLQNTMFAKISANADVMKGLNVGGAIAFLNAARKSIGAGTPDAIVGYNQGIPTYHKYIGTEIDLSLTYQIDKGLKYFVEGGYLFAGNYWKDALGSWVMMPDQGIAWQPKQKISDPWVVRHGLQLNF